ncbi:hypothetical protein CON70_11675 [Bacillus pseudomycoides]|uniref:hypothetical protein n=1 Tax=Bacillus pseudomycoides TaxID=64104 RepID=UPI000BEBC624|nr:hypothetical protein [Bacillus pseudomycoides]PDZ11431.1 hypothetical protein CON70_11675 [Bacillus pseudomycoides]
MANLLSKVLGTTNKESLEKKASDLQGKISELSTKVSRVRNSLELVETELMIDESTANKKRVEKFNRAIEEFNADMSKAGEQLAEVQAKLHDLAQEERKAHLEELAKQDAEDKELYKKELKLRHYLSLLSDSMKASHSGYSLLERELGIKVTGNPNTDTTWHSFPDEMAMKEEAEQVVTEKVDAEFEELVRTIEKYLGR